MTANIQSLRIPLILPFAAIITVALFLLMRQLIDIGPVHRAPEAELPDVVIKFEPVEAEPDFGSEMILVDPVTPPPARPRLDTPTGAVDSMGTGVTYTMPTIARAEISGSGSIVITEREPVPVVRVQPNYPMRAAERMLEGQCTILFDITPLGTTANVRPLDCTSALFESASVRAVSNWRYNPQMEDGQPTTYRGATTQLVFRLDE
jgi:protein TonB